MTADLFILEGLDSAVAALKRDLLAPGGPSISTMRNHNFAILLYLPRDEYRLRQRVRQMVHALARAFAARFAMRKLPWDGQVR